jgi:hypothetical protein
VLAALSMYGTIPWPVGVPEWARNTTSRDRVFKAKGNSPFIDFSTLFESPVDGLRAVVVIFLRDTREEKNILRDAAAVIHLARRACLAVAGFPHVWKKAYPATPFGKIAPQIILLTRAFAAYARDAHKDVKKYRTHM